MKLTDKAERIPHSRNADWRSDLCTQKRETQQQYHTGETYSQPCSEGRKGERDCMVQRCMCCRKHHACEPGREANTLPRLGTLYLSSYIVHGANSPHEEYKTGQWEGLWNQVNRTMLSLEYGFLSYVSVYI